jgi:hypothetical protein
MRFKSVSILLVTACMAALVCAGCGDNQTAAPEYAAYEPGGLEPLECVPNLDNKIDASELREALGIPVTYIVSPAGVTRAVDIAGSVNAAGERRWDMSGRGADERAARLIATDLTGKWYAASFPQGQFVTALDLGGRNEAIYRRDDEAFYLLGLASAEENPAEGQTLFVYEPPIALYRFPLEVGKQWVSTGTVTNGKFRGLPYAGRDTYEIKVEAVGTVVLPELTFDQSLQVRTKLTATPSVGQPVVTQQISYIFECFGEVARATSRDNEQEAFFTTASEVRRLGIQ